MTRREISAGGVVYRDTGRGAEVALIQPRERQAWALPKGVIEPGETPEAAAEREIREETGLCGTVVDRIDSIEYSYMARWETPPVRVLKTVTFFLVRYVSGVATTQDSEIDAVAWVPLSEAPRRATYPQEKEVLRKAQDLLATDQR